MQTARTAVVLLLALIVFSSAEKSRLFHRPDRDAAAVRTAAISRQLHRPDPNDAAIMARWLVGCSSWGVVSTVSVHLNGIPFGNVVSYSDGMDDNITGIPYFYMSFLDPTPKDLAVIPYASLTISEAPLGTCSEKDVENPTCAKITLSGQLLQIQVLDEGTDEAEFAALALFSRHPEMEGAFYMGFEVNHLCFGQELASKHSKLYLNVSGWPEDHYFKFFELKIQDIFLIDVYGGAKIVSMDDYLGNTTYSTM